MNRRKTLAFVMLAAAIAAPFLTAAPAGASFSQGRSCPVGQEQFPLRVTYSSSTISTNSLKRIDYARDFFGSVSLTGGTGTTTSLQFNMGGRDLNGTAYTQTYEVGSATSVTVELPFFFRYQPVAGALPGTSWVSLNTTVGVGGSISLIHLNYIDYHCVAIASPTYANDTFESRTHANLTFEGRAHANATFESRAHANVTFEGRAHVNSTFEGAAYANLTFEGRAHANATFESRAHANATYESRAHANATQTGEALWQNSTDGVCRLAISTAVASHKCVGSIWANSTDGFCRYTDCRGNLTIASGQALEVSSAWDGFASFLPELALFVAAIAALRYRAYFAVAAALLYGAAWWAADLGLDGGGWPITKTAGMVAALLLVLLQVFWTVRSDANRANSRAGL